jgi:Fe-Mn family superoxide dismutase
MLMNYSHRDGRLHNQVGFDHTQSMVDAAPILVLDLYEHAYHIDFGANATAYIDAFMRNIDWTVVAARMKAASGAMPAANAAADPLPSITIEELATELESNAPIQVLDARPKHYFTRTADMMRGATWRDPTRVDDWSSELARDRPVYVYCAYGFYVGCEVTAQLRERGYDAKYIRGGLSAWYAAGGPRALSPTVPSVD